MKHLLEWLLDLQAIRLGEEASPTIRFQLAWPPWIIVLGITALGTAVYVVYRLEGGRPWGRIVCGILRLMLVFLMLGLLLQPVLLLRRSRVEPSEVVLLVDDSASMGTSDRYPQGKDTDALIRAVELSPAASARTTDGAQSPSPASKALDAAPARGIVSTRSGAVADLSRRSRAELLKAALSAHGWSALRGFAARNRLAVYSFGSEARLQASPAGPDALGPAQAWLRGFQPSDSQTNITGALRQVLSENRTGRLSGIVLASDGRSTVGGDIDAAARKAAETGVAIHAVMLGSTERRRDVAVGPALADDTAFVKDPIAVRTQITAEGFDAAVPLTVQLSGEDGRPLDRQVITVGPGDSVIPVELRYRPEHPGRLRMRVFAEPLDDEANPNNNAELVEVNVVDEKVRVLYVEGCPRYEYRYLKNMLVREKTITASCLLLSADEGFVQEGTEPIKRFPETAEELRPFDVVILGDADPRGEWLSDRQAELLVKWVGDRGGGFVMIAGPRWSPQAYVGTPLERLIPVRIDPQIGGQGETALTNAFRLGLTVEGRRSSVFRFEADPKLNETALANLPGMYWFARTQGARPGAEVLAEHPTARTVDGAMPLLVTGRYGAGTTVFAGVEETWRWRRYVGDAWFDTFWLQLIRHATRSQLLGRDRRFVLRTERSSYELGQPVTLSLTGTDPAEASAWPDRVFIDVRDARGHEVAHVPLTRLGKGAATYEGAFTPGSPGGLVARAEPSLVQPGQAPPSVIVHVRAGGPELRQLEPDHTALRQVASRTGGLAVGLADLGRIAERLVDRSVRVPDDIAEPLWDTKLVLVLFVFIMTSEWLLRKATGMV